MSSSSCKNATVLQDGKNAKCAPALTLYISQLAAVLSGSSMMNVLMVVLASSLDNEIFTVLLELPTQHFPGLTFFLHRSACQ